MRNKVRHEHKKIEPKNNRLINLNRIIETPLGQLPYLEVNFHVHLPQSIAIARLIAKRANLYGDSDLEQAKTDAVVDTVSDLTNAMAQSLYYAEDKEASKKKLIEETAPQHLKRLETIISLYGTSGHSVGSSLKWSDLAIFDVIQKVEAVDASLINDSHPNIKAVKKTVESHEKIAEYLKKRPETPF